MQELVSGLLAASDISVQNTVENDLHYTTVARALVSQLSDKNQECG